MDGETPTARQLQILALRAQGASRQQVGAELCLSPLTIRNLTNDLRVCLGVATELQAVATCIARGMLCVDGRDQTVYVPESLDAVA